MTLQGAGPTGGNVKSQWSSRDGHTSTAHVLQAPPPPLPALVTFNLPPSSLPEEPDLGTGSTWKFSRR